MSIGPDIQNMVANKKYKKAIVVMRAQPPHKAHLGLARHALQCADEVVIVLGSSFHARTPRNPFTAAEREHMLRLGLAGADLGRITFLPIRDYYDNARWAAAIRRAVQPDSMASGEIVIVGHEKDATSAYLRDFPGWGKELVPSLGLIDATSVRNAMFDAADPAIALSAFADSVDAPIREYLQAHLHRPEWAQLRMERKRYLDEASLWGPSPKEGYTRFVLCADALIQWGDEVLLFRRGPGLGEGLLAMPGGHVEGDETSLQAAIRELREEVGIGLLDDELVRSLQGQYFLEAPGRSQRPGRVVSMVFKFVINSAKRPQVSDSAEGRVEWTKISDLADLEGEFFEDHFMGFDHFYGLTD